MSATALLRSNGNLPFSVRTIGDRSSLDAAVLRALTDATTGSEADPRYVAMTREDITIRICIPFRGVVEGTIGDVAPMVSAACRRLRDAGVIRRGGCGWVREGRP